MTDYGGYTRDAKELAIMQSYPLDMKVMLTRDRIYEWVDKYGVDGCCVSFSGGKDSTVLLHLVRTYFPDVKAVFSNTGLEYPEIQRFVKSFDNVDIVTPKMRFDEVISTYGYPLISKEVAEAIYYARRIRTPDEHTNRREALTGNLEGRSQDVNVERERAEQASSSTREQSYSERERQDIQSKTVPHGEMSTPPKKNRNTGTISYAEWNCSEPGRRTITDKRNNRPRARTEKSCSESTAEPG